MVVVVVLKATLVFSFGPNLKLWFWPRLKLNNIVFCFGPRLGLKTPNLSPLVCIEPFEKFSVGG